MFKPVNWHYWFLNGDSPTPAWKQSLNDALHTEPLSTIAYGVVWSLVLFMGAPLAGVALTFVTMIKLLLWAVGYYNTKTITADDSKAIVITGCDSGFGKELALDCARKGYHVFAACLKKESMAVFANNNNITPLVVDVSKDESVDKMQKIVLEWIAQGNNSAEQKKRFLHAVVNNAGVGTSGLVDWLTMSDYENCIQVNFLGMVRVTKAFLPHLKDQAAAADAALSYNNNNINNASAAARIVNVVSVAGLVPGLAMTPYNASKYAAEGFSSCLRLELRDFGIHVVTMNPTFHPTALTAGMADKCRRDYNNLPQDIQTKYGPDYVEKNMIPFINLVNGVMWRSANVVQDMGRAIDLVHPPPRYVTGMDGRFAFLVTRMLPDVVQSWFIPRYLHPPAFRRRATRASGDENKEKKQS